MAPKPKPSAASIRRAEEAFKAKTPAEIAQIDANAQAVAQRVGVPAVVANVENPNLVNWRDYFVSTLRSWGLESLAPKAIEFVNKGYTGNTVILKLQETPEYKTRFAANETRIKAGLPPVDPSDYLALENQYRAVMRNAGTPTGFYDSNDDFSKFIANDVSPSELKARVDLADLSLNSSDPYYSNALESLYGISKGDMIAYVLDPQRAIPFINRQVQTAQISAEAARQGLQPTKSMAETYAGMGVTQAQARQGFEEVATILPEAQKLSQITAGAQPFGLEETTTAVFGGEGSAEQKRRLQRLAQTEQSRFAGQSGVGQPSLGRTTQGQF